MPTPPLPPQTAGALNDQTKQLEKIVDDLNEMEFDIKKATQVIRDITRGMLTDKWVRARRAGGGGGFAHVELSCSSAVVVLPPLLGIQHPSCSRTQVFSEPCLWCCC